MCQVQMIRDTKKGEYVRRNATTNKTYRRGDYDASSKRYSLIDCDDMNREIFLSGKTLVHVGFTY